MQKILEKLLVRPKIRNIRYTENMKICAANPGISDANPAIFHAKSGTFVANPDISDAKSAIFAVDRAIVVADSAICVLIPNSFRPESKIAWTHRAGRRIDSQDTDKNS